MVNRAAGSGAVSTSEPRGRRGKGGAAGKRLLPFVTLSGTPGRDAAWERRTARDHPETRSGSSHTSRGRPGMGIMRRVRRGSVNTKGLCHESERVTEAESHSESQDIDSHAEQIQKYIYALVLWLLLDALADLPQFFRLHVFGRAGFWCHGGNGCRVVFQTHTRGARRGVNLVDRIALRNRRARVLTSCSHKHTGDFAAALRMDPCAFTATGEPDRPDPARFRYEITSRALTA